MNFYFFIESGYHVAQTGLKLLNLLSASASQVLGLDLYAYHAWLYATLGQIQGLIACQVRTVPSEPHPWSQDCIS